MITLSLDIDIRIIPSQELFKLKERIASNSLIMVQYKIGENNNSSTDNSQKSERFSEGYR